MDTPFVGMRLDGLPTLFAERGLKAISVGDDTFETRSQMQQDELGIQFERERITERRFNGEAAKIVGRAAESPELERIPDAWAG
jgi:hypothetical protein